MDKTDIILWVAIGGFCLMLIMWHHLGTKIENVGTRVRFNWDGKPKRNIENEIQITNKNLQQINTRLTELENKINHINNI